MPNRFLLYSLSVLAGALAAVSPRPALCGFAFAVLWLSPRLRLSGVSLCLLLFAASAWRAADAIDGYKELHSATRQGVGAPKRCALEATVVSSPSKRGGSLSFNAFVRRGDCEGSPMAPGVVRLYGGPANLARGDQFEGIAQLGVVRIFRNSGMLDPFPGFARRQATLSGSLLSFDPMLSGSGLAAHIDRARAHVRARIEATFAAPAIGMAKALVLGENDLTEEEDAAFKGSGLAHLLAVSGTHLVFAVVSVVSALTQLLLRFPSLAEGRHMARWSACVGAPLALLYADFAGGSGSAWRAAWMLAATFVVRALGRELRAPRAVAVSIFVGWCVDPLAVFDLSFMLSLAATTGLLTLGRRFGKLAGLVAHKGAKLFITGVVATVSSMVPCAALLALLAPSISMVGILANVLAGPFGEVVALPLCLGHTLLSFWPALEQGTATVASGALLVVKQVALTSHDLGFLSLWVPFPTANQFVVLCVTALVVATLPNEQPLAIAPLPRVVRFFPFQRRLGSLTARLGSLASLKRKHLAAALLLTGASGFVGLEFVARKSGNPLGQLRVTVLDVGQGDASLVDLPNGELLLIDGGGFVGSPVDPGSRVILPMLRARRRERIDVMVLSHPHPDHFGGLLSVTETVRVGEFWDTGQGELEGAGPGYARLLDALRHQGTVIRRPVDLCSGPTTLGGARLDVLGPCPRVVPGRNANDNSWVFRLGHGEHAVLFTGDAEAHQESELLERSRPRLKANLLKVGHHGSRTSTSPEFLNAVSPAFATISCGMRNRFGHPHAVTEATLRTQAVPYARLDDSGSVIWTTDGHHISIRSYASAPRRSPAAYVATAHNVAQAAATHEQLRAARSESPNSRRQ